MTKLTSDWEVLASEVTFPHPYLTVREDMVKLPNGDIIPDYSVWEHPDVAQVVPILPNGNFILVSLYKHGIGKRILEFPGGFCEKFESPKQAAARELIEETGYKAKHLSHLGTVCHHPSKETGMLHLYLCTKLAAVAKSTDPTENAALVELTPQQLHRRLAQESTVQTSTWLGYFLAMEHLRNAT